MMIRVQIRDDTVCILPLPNAFGKGMNQFFLPQSMNK